MFLLTAQTFATRVKIVKVVNIKGVLYTQNNQSKILVKIVQVMLAKKKV